MSYRLITAFTA